MKKEYAVSTVQLIIMVFKWLVVLNTVSMWCVWKLFWSIISYSEFCYRALVWNFSKHCSCGEEKLCLCRIVHSNGSFFIIPEEGKLKAKKENICHRSLCDKLGAFCWTLGVFSGTGRVNVLNIAAPSSIISGMGDVMNTWYTLFLVGASLPTSDYSKKV